MSDLISVIIPIYNVEAYLERCIDSVLRQTYDNLQIILVNDGSIDKSGEICDVYAKAHRHVQVIHQPNGGISAARNTGVRHAEGDWIFFVDSDDYISCHFAKEMLNACVKYDADISVCNYITDYDGICDESKFRKAEKYELITSREATKRHFGKDADRLNIANCKIIRSSLLKRVQFPVGKINEDVFASHHLMYYAHRVVLTDACFYAYYQCPSSIMRKPFSLKRLDVLCSWYEGVRLFESIGETRLADIARRVYLNRLYDAYSLCKKFLPNEHEAHNNLRRRAIDMYKTVKHVRSYEDLTLAQAAVHRLKQLIGRYCPALYYFLFLRKRVYI